MKSSIILISLLIATHALICNTAAFGGGGSLGAHSAGAFQAFIELLPASAVNYTALSGISVGSLNSFAISQFPPGQEALSVELLLSAWKSITDNQDIYEDWPGGLVAGILFHSGLYNTKPESNLIKKWAAQSPKRKLSQGTVEINSGMFTVYNESLSVANMQESTMCSSAIPTFFENQKFNGGVYCDGGLFVGVDVPEAIERCLEVTQDQTEIFVDVFACFGTTLPPDPSKMKTMEVLQRSYEIKAYTTGMKSLTSAKQAFPKVNFRYYVQPREANPSPLNFTSAAIEIMLQNGYNDAVKLINGGPNLEKVIKEVKEIIIYA